MPATQEGWILPPAVGVFLHVGHSPTNPAAQAEKLTCLSAQINYRTMQIVQRVFHQLSEE
jgi:hypothetical protein